jgi:hypothetical protein
LDNFVTGHTHTLFKLIVATSSLCMLRENGDACGVPPVKIDVFPV